MASPDSGSQFSLASRSLKLDDQESIEPHLKPLIKSPTSFTSIDLSGNTLGVPASAYLSTLLPSLTSLEHANLADIFTSRVLSEIPPALSSLLTALLKCPKLRTVDLSDNAFGLNTVGPLVDFLSQHVPLQHLILQNNGLGPDAGAQVAQALTTLAQKKDEARQKDSKGDAEVPELETVVCGRNRLENGSMAAWAKCYQANKSVRTVKMVQNGIRQQGIVLLLTDGLGACQKIEELDLQDNTFTHAGSVALSGVIGRWIGLRVLGIGDCYLQPRGMTLVAQEISKGANKSLEVLRLQYNEIDAKAVKAVARTVEQVETLRRVELNGNKFAEDDEGVEKVRILLEKRKEKAGETAEGEEWGIDELSDLEEESDEEEDAGSDAEVEKEEEMGKRDQLLKEADQAEDQNVAEKPDKDVDALADKLGKTHV